MIARSTYNFKAFAISEVLGKREAIVGVAFLYFLIEKGFVCKLREAMTNSKGKIS